MRQTHVAYSKKPKEELLRLTPEVRALSWQDQSKALPLTADDDMEIPDDDDEGVEEIPVQDAVSRMSKKSGSLAQRSQANDSIYGAAAMAGGGS